MTVSRQRTLAFAFIGFMLPMAALAGEGAVYAMTNQQGANKNQIVVWTRAQNGKLTYIQTISTGGGGSGVQLDGTDSLGSQGSLALAQDQKFLFAVNTETASGTSGDCNMGTITSFRISGQDGYLTFASRVSSGGLYPNSLAVQGNQLYVLNSGGPGNLNACGAEPNITGFQFDGNGNLTPIAGSTQSLSAGPMPGSSINPTGPLNCDPGTTKFTAATFDCGLNPPAFPRSPAAIKFTPDGRFLVVTVKGTNSIYVFPMQGDGVLPTVSLRTGGGLPGTPAIWKAKGPNQPTYFGFSFDSHGHLIVAEPFGASATIPAAPASAVSSFSIGLNGSLTPISTDVANVQALACWVAMDPITGQYAFISNNGSGTVSSYQVNSNGSLTLLNAGAGSGMSHPNDMATARAGNSAYVYALDSAGGAVFGWQISGGSMTSLGAASSFTLGAGAAPQGLVAY